MVQEKLLNIKKKTLIIIKLIVSVGLLYLLFKFVDIKKFAEMLKNADRGLIVCALFAQGIILFFSIRKAVFLSSRKIEGLLAFCKN